MIDYLTLRDLMDLTVRQAQLLAAIHEAQGYPADHGYPWTVTAARGLRERGLLGDDWELTERGRAVAERLT